MKKLATMIGMALCFALMFCCSNISIALAGEIVEPTTAKILVNGVPQNFEVYENDQNNYFKLRDLAFALQNTPKTFDVAWDGSKNAIMLSKNTTYTGGAVAPTKGRTKIANYNNSSIYIDGEKVALGSLNIENDTYFRLRDIMDKLAIYVAWDEKTQTIAIDTEHEYIPSTPSTSSLPLTGRLICIDPGHGTFTKQVQDPIAPNSKTTKPGFVSGTAGATHSEAQVNLAVALQLKTKLEAQGAKVLLTREGAEATLTNAERAKLANDANADLVVRLHCDGSSSPSTSGMSLLLPSKKYVKADIVATSNEVGNIVFNSTLKATGAKNHAITTREDLAGFNWSTVPVILLEMGFMTNPAEDKQLSSQEYQNKLAEGIANGVAEYFQPKGNTSTNIQLKKGTSPTAIRVANYQKQKPNISQATALWQVKMNMDKPEFKQAKVLSKEELTSLTVIVNKRARVENDYKPADLVQLTGKVALRAEAKTAFENMQTAAKNEGFKISPVSGYRSVAYQKGIYNRYAKTDSIAQVDTYSARPGFSEHHTGMAIDIAGPNNNMSTFGSTKESTWITKNADQYGFIVRYQPSSQNITGYKNEPWHLRYVGSDVAKTMKQEGIKTLEEYVGKFLI